MLTPISTNTSPVRVQSSTQKACCSPEGNKAHKDVENACKAKAMKENVRAKKESKGPILKRKMACATCRRRKVSKSRHRSLDHHEHCLTLCFLTSTQQLRCDAARPRCSTCARSQASAEAAGHPSAVPPGPCVYDCDSCDEPPQSRFFANGSFHSLTFHSNFRNQMISDPMDAGMESMNILPPTSPYGVWAFGEMPLTPSRAGVYDTSCNSTPLSSTPTRPNVLTSTPMRRIISPSLTINSTPVQEHHDLFYSPPSQKQWTPSSQPMNLEPMYVSPMVSPMVSTFGEAMQYSASSAASTPSLVASRTIRSPFGMVQDLGTPASLAPSTPCSETFGDSCLLGPPIMANQMVSPISPQEQQIKCTNFLQSLEPMPYDLLDFSAANPMCSQDSFAMVGPNDLGLINGPPVETKLQEPFTSASNDMVELSTMSMDANSLAHSTLSSAMPIDFTSCSGLPTTEWTL